MLPQTATTRKHGTLRARLRYDLLLFAVAFCLLPASSEISFSVLSVFSVVNVFVFAVRLFPLCASAASAVDVASAIEQRPWHTAGPRGILQPMRKDTLQKLSDPELLAVRDMHMQRLRAVFDGVDPEDAAFVLCGTATGVGPTAFIPGRDDP
jgi:hypothetical protein